MKTRIKELKYGDGKFSYYVQSKMNFNFFKQSIILEFNENPIFMIVFLIPIIIISLIISLFWITEFKTVSINDAEAYVDNILNEELNQKRLKIEKKQKEKLAKKVVSKTYIKYP